LAKEGLRYEALAKEGLRFEALAKEGLRFEALAKEGNHDSFATSDEATLRHAANVSQ